MVFCFRRRHLWVEVGVEREANKAPRTLEQQMSSARLRLSRCGSRPWEESMILLEIALFVEQFDPQKI